MTSQSINSLDALLKKLISSADGYYIEQKSITKSINIDGETIYTRFKYFSGKITPILLNQHISKDINLAINLNRFDALVLEYSGKYREAFVSLVSYYLNKNDRDNIYITTQDNLKIVLYIELKENSLENFIKMKQKVTQNLQKRLEKEWRVLPNNLQPLIGTLLQLPREFIKLS